MLKDVTDQDFQGLHARYQTIELELYNIKRSLETIERSAHRLSLCAAEEIQNDVKAIGKLYDCRELVAQLDEMVCKRKTDLIAESNERYSSKR
ncbi:MAG: hypothetical protein PHT95_03565 [Candidatus Omnitrophica bacterium]|nr:hypothetical protein [Candidatus Omnitrophota bacterium]